MGEAAKKMAELARKLLNREPIGSAGREGYIKRDIILNEEQPQNAAVRAIEMVLKKIKGEAFESELLPPKFDVIEPAAPVDALKNMRIAVVTDGGLIPESNPDHLKPNGSTTWGEYNWKNLMSDKHFVIHSGYDGTWVMENANRLLPVDVLQKYADDGKIENLDSEVFVACGNCASVAASKAIGEQIAQRLLERKINAVLLTST